MIISSTSEINDTCWRCEYLKSWEKLLLLSLTQVFSRGEAIFIAVISDGERKTPSGALVFRLFALLTNLLILVFVEFILHRCDKGFGSARRNIVLKYSQASSRVLQANYLDWSSRNQASAKPEDFRDLPAFTKEVRFLQKVSHSLLSWVVGDHCVDKKYLLIYRGYQNVNDEIICATLLNIEPGVLRGVFHCNLLKSEDKF